MGRGSGFGGVPGVSAGANDLLLEWASERGRGNWQRFRDAHDWAHPPAARPAWRGAGFTVRQMSALGHIEIDWQAGFWAAAPPVLTLLPSAGGHALLTGGRTRALIDRLDAELRKRGDLYGLDPYAQEVAPSAILIASGDEEAIQSLADALGVSYVHSASARRKSVV